MTKRFRLLSPLLLLIAILLAGCGGTDGDGDADGDGPSVGATQASASETQVSGEPTSDGNDGGNGGNSGNDAQVPEIPGAINNDGTIIVDGESYDVQTVLRCEPFGDEEDAIDLTALTGDVTVFVYSGAFAGAASQEVSLQGPMGIFSGMQSQIGDGWVNDNLEPIEGAPFEVSGNRISGAMTVIEAREETETVDVSFELPIPETIIDCQQ